MDRIKEADDHVTAAAILGDGWEDALSRLSDASGAHGAVLMRNRADRMLAAVTTDEIAESVQAFAAGRAPPSSRYARVRYGRTPRFRVDEFGRGIPWPRSRAHLDTVETVGPVPPGWE